MWFPNGGCRLRNWENNKIYSLPIKQIQNMVYCNGLWEHGYIFFDIYVALKCKNTYYHALTLHLDSHYSSKYYL